MLERLRVLHVLPHVEYGGAAQMAINLMTALDPQQFEVHLVCLYDRPPHPMLGNIRTHILHKSHGFDGRVVLVVHFQIKCLLFYHELFIVNLSFQFSFAFLTTWNMAFFFYFYQEY